MVAGFLKILDRNIYIETWRFCVFTTIKYKQPQTPYFTLVFYYCRLPAPWLLDPSSGMASPCDSLAAVSGCYGGCHHTGGARIPLALNVAKQRTTAECTLLVVVWRLTLRIVILTILRRLTKFAAHVKDEVTHLSRFCCA